MTAAEQSPDCPTYSTHATGRSYPTDSARSLLREFTKEPPIPLIDEEISRIIAEIELTVNLDDLAA